MKLLKNIMAVSLVTAFCACSHKPTENLVGNDRDEHGCIASAGYRWSEVRKDCIRIWEAGERLDNRDKKVYVVFGKDSVMAEVYLDDGRCITCKKYGDEWMSRKKDVRLSISDGRIMVSAYGVEYRKPYMVK